MPIVGRNTAITVISVLLLILLTTAFLKFNDLVKGDMPEVIAEQRLLYADRPLPGGTVHRDIFYRRGFFNRQKLDIYMPTREDPVTAHGGSSGAENTKAAVPAVIFVHGGSWLHGSKEDIRVIDRFLRKMRDRGWAVVSIDYVAGPLGMLGVPEKNVRSALSWISKNAGNYGIDPERLGLYSVSAGSHLVLTALNSMEEPGRSWRFWLNEYGPVDLEALADGESTSGASRLSRIPSAYLRKHSPIRFISKPLPPTTIVHGDADAMVDPAQSRRLASRLYEVGTEVNLEIIPGGDHGFFNLSQSEWEEMEDRFIPAMARHFNK